ncbi:MAG: sensor histidine kinase [Alphaproteobacteria bacterium]|nr:MAG: sensor histidine kinase [Alphaproteobacteria bacterium]
MDDDLTRALLSGAAQMIAAGDITLVLLDTSGRVVRQQGVLAADRHHHLPASEAWPFLAGLEDRLRAVAAGTEPAFCLPRLALVGPEGQGPVITVHVFARGEGCLGLVLQDVSSLVQLERQVLQQRNDLALAREGMERATREAISANRAKSDFLLRLSRELRTPLNAILGFADLLTSGSDPLNEEQRGFLTDIAQSGRQMLTMVDDLLDLSQVESGGLTIQRQPIDVALLAREVEELMEPSAHSQAIRYTTEVPDGLMVQGDPRLCRQILINLVRNAIRATPPGGRVTITARAVPDWLDLVVEDTGIGMTEDEVRLALTAFSQIRSGAAGSSGLGLPLTLRFVEAHGGTFSLTSAPGHGTRALVSLPMKG